MIAIGAYGSTATRTWTRHSDVDVVAVLDRDPDLESLRFFVEGIPVDLNLRSNDDSDHGIGGAAFMPDTIAIWDPDEVFTSAKVTSNPSVTGEVRPLRYMLRHNINKLLQVSRDTQKARLIAGSEVGQVTRAYFLARRREFPGPLSCLDVLRSECPELLDLLERSLVEISAAPSLLEQASEIALQPVGGIWKPGEVFAVGWSSRENLSESINEYLEPVLKASDPPRKFV